MPRKARSRILYDYCFAHVFSRSIEKKYIFDHPDEFELFRQLLLVRFSHRLGESIRKPLWTHGVASKVLRRSYAL